MKLNRKKEKFVIDLENRLKEELPKPEDDIKESIFNEKLMEIFYERENPREAIKTYRQKKEDEQYIDRISADIIEKKLDFIEEELTNRGIIVKIVDGKIIFEEK